MDNAEPLPAQERGGAHGSEGEREKPRPVRVVRYGAMGWVGEFTQKPGAVFVRGTKLVVQTERGIELGEPVGVPCEGMGCDVLVPRQSLQTYVKNCGPEFCRPRAGRILRAATQQDINEQDHLNAHVREDIQECAALAHRLGLDMKIVAAEHLLGGERIVFYFTGPGRVDFRQLVKELAQRYRTRIEMRQVGARDEARLVADYEVCGRECCCRNFLKKLRPVDMKMAKLQKSTLDPSKVSGRCGRLRCCLRYERIGYEQLAARLPRVGSRVLTDFGPGTVVDRQVLTQLVSVRADDSSRVFVIPVEEIRAFDIPPPAGEVPTDQRTPAPDAAEDESTRRPRRGQTRPAAVGSGVSRFEPLPGQSPPAGQPSAGPGREAQPSSETPAPPAATEAPVSAGQPGVESTGRPSAADLSGDAGTGLRPRPGRRRRRGRRQRSRRGGPLADQNPPPAAAGA